MSGVLRRLLHPVMADRIDRQFTPGDRAARNRWNDLHAEVWDGQLTAPRTTATGFAYRSVIFTDPDGMRAELAFRSYARRSGEHLRDRP